MPDFTDGRAGGALGADRGDGTSARARRRTAGRSWWPALVAVGAGRRRGCGGRQRLQRAHRSGAGRRRGRRARRTGRDPRPQGPRLRCGARRGDDRHPRSRRQQARERALSWEIESLVPIRREEPSLVSTGAVRLWMAGHALCSWSDVWAGAVRTGDSRGGGAGGRRDPRGAHLAVDHRHRSGARPASPSSHWLPDLEQAVRSDDLAAAEAALGPQPVLPAGTRARAGTGQAVVKPAALARTWRSCTASTPAELHGYLYRRAGPGRGRPAGRGLPGRDPARGRPARARGTTGLAVRRRPAAAARRRPGASGSVTTPRTSAPGSTTRQRTAGRRRGPTGCEPCGTRSPPCASRTGS